MLKNAKKNIVYMALKGNEEGFTLLSMMFTIVVISLTIPFLMALLKAMPYTTNYNATSIQHFFYFLRDDLLLATNYSIQNNKLYLELTSGEIATIEKYDSLIRRQVDHKGHEVYVRDVKDLLFTNHPYGIQVMITTLQGEIYEKTIIFYE